MAGLAQLLAEMKAGEWLNPTHLEQMRALAASEQPALSRHHFEPGHFTASALVLHPDGQKLLLIFHKKLQMWLQPGGHIEPTDLDLVTASRRELVEETGLEDVRLLEPAFDIDVHQIPALGSEPPHLHHDVRALWYADAEEIKAGDGVTDCRWFTLTEISQNLHELAGGAGTDDSVRRVAAHLLTLDHM